MICFLTGYMGSGKTSLGRELAKRLNFRFLDMDKQIEKQAGMSVAEIFASQGEEGFRALERQILNDLCSEQDDVVIATGGGVPCFGDNMDVMNCAGLTVYLSLTPKRLVKRLEHGRDKRPIIRGMDDRQLLEFIESNLKVREHYYNKAKLIVDCNGASDSYIIEHIRRYIDSTAL